MPIYRAGSHSASRRIAKNKWKSAAAKASIVAAWKPREKPKQQSQGEKDTSAGDKNSKSTVSLQVPTLDKGKRKKLNRLLMDMYAEDFTEDMRMLLLLLKELHVSDEDMNLYRKQLVKMETKNMEEAFKKRIEVQGKVQATTL